MRFEKFEQLLEKEWQGLRNQDSVQISQRDKVLSLSIYELLDKKTREKLKLKD